MIMSQSYVLPHPHNALVVITCLIVILKNMIVIHFSGNGASEAVISVQTTSPAEPHARHACDLLQFRKQKWCHLSSPYSPFVGGSGGNTKGESCK